MQCIMHSDGPSEINWLTMSILTGDVEVKNGVLKTTTTTTKCVGRRVK